MENGMSTHFIEGSLWHQWDLHFHTPSSFDYEDKSVTNQQIVDTLIAAGVRVVAVTDHHTMDVARIRELQALSGDKLTVLPGIELRSDQGGDPIHYISIFDEDCNLDHVWDTLRGKLDLTEQAITDQGGDDAVHVPIENGAAVTRELGGIVSIHAGTKSNSIESIKNNEQFQMRIKLNITDKWVDVMEIGQIKDIDVHLDTIFPTIALTRPLAICSDNHSIGDYSRKAALWLKADPTFRGLLMVLQEPRDRVHIGDVPPELRRIAENSTKYISRISFKRDAGTPKNQRWFEGDVHFNPGLVAIVGNKGSGKSALSDTLGLLGATKNSESFSFLTRDRFRHPKAGFASYFEAEIEWRSGDKQAWSLEDPPPDEEPERLKYLPQDHVEKVCNELDGVGKGDFERELKSVIFSHVPDESRLGQNSLDDLVRFNAEEKQKRIDTLLKQLRELSRKRALAEEQQAPRVRLELEEKVKRKLLEIEAHDKAKPDPRPDPKSAPDASIPDPALTQQLEALEKTKADIAEQFVGIAQQQKAARRRLAVAKRLLERIENYSKEHEAFVASITEDANELGLNADKLVTLTINTATVAKIETESSAAIASLVEKEGVDDSEGLKRTIRETNEAIAEIHAKLDAPNRAYRDYLKHQATWSERRSELVGEVEAPESLEGLKASLAALDLLPQTIADIKAQQLTISKDIHGQKNEKAAVLRSLYGHVQEFIDGHELASDKLKLEFRAELIDQGFAPNLLRNIAQNRKGSFMGTDEGKARALSLSEAVEWAETESVEAFLETIDKSLHEDQREDEPKAVQLVDQLAKGHSAEDVFNFLYGLEYIEPRYILRWEGKDLSMLSPGERGTLLLVFYLLVDKGDLPLIIDQPEGNLDNHTVARVLVDCIREARKRRQVFIVTHNPNLAVVCDADQVVHATMDKEHGNAITYETGALENPKISKYVTDVLEGTRWAFGVRGDKYKVGEEAGI